MQPKNYTEEQKDYIINDVQTKKASGERGIKDGCLDNDINPSVYYGWLKQRGLKPKQRKKSTALVTAKSVHHAFPIDPPLTTIQSRGITIKGSPEDLGTFLRALAGRGVA